MCLFDMTCKCIFCLLSHLIRQQMGIEVWTVGTQRWVIVIAELQAEGCVVVMKCYDGEGWYSWPACTYIVAEQKPHSESLLQNTHFSPSSHVFSALQRALSHSHTLTCRQDSFGSSLKHSRSHTQGHTLLLSLHTANGRGGVYPGLAPGQLIDRWGAFLNLDAKEWA